MGGDPVHTATSSRFSRRGSATLIAFVAAFVALLLGAGTATAATSADPWYVASWGGGGSGDGQFAGPCGVAVDAGGSVYVTDRGNNRIQKFTGSGAFVASFGGYGSGDEAVQLAGRRRRRRQRQRLRRRLGQRSRPEAEQQRGVPGQVGRKRHRRRAVQPSLRRRRRRQRQRLRHRYQQPPRAEVHERWGRTSPSGAVSAPATGSSTSRAASPSTAPATSTSPTAATTASRSSPQAGAFLAEWGSNGSGDGEFKNPAGIAVDAAGNVHVADTDNFRIQEFTAAGAFVTKWGTNGSGDAQFDYPLGIAVDGSRPHVRHRLQQQARPEVGLRHGRAEYRPRRVGRLVAEAPPSTSR